jgi:hypothetical protein
MDFEPEEILYVETYLKTWSKSKAYKAISPNVTKGSAYSLGAEYFKKVEVQCLLRMRLEELKAGPEEVVATITNIHRNGKSNASRLRAAELLGRIHGLFIDRQELNVKGTISWAEFISKQDGDGDKSS